MPDGLSRIRREIRGSWHLAYRGGGAVDGVVRRDRGGLCIVRLSLAILIPLGGVLAACEPYRVEYHKRSPIYFNEKVVQGEIGGTTTLADGTVLVFEPVQTSTSFGRTGDEASRPFMIREETEDGEVILRALLPEHVLMNLLACLRAEEYDVIYDKLLAIEAREAFEADGGVDAFRNYMMRHRVDLARYLNRMIAAIPQQQVRFEKVAPDITRCVLVRSLRRQFKFRRVIVVRESGQFKLLSVG